MNTWKYKQAYEYLWNFIELHLSPTSEDKDRINEEMDYIFGEKRKC